MEDLPASLVRNYTDTYTIPVLRKSDALTDYGCEVVMNTSPQITANEHITLTVTRKLCTKSHLYI